MKRTLLVVFCFLFCMLCLFASQKAPSLVKVDILDDFGDPTGESYFTFDSDLSGTYKNSYTTKGYLDWNILINSQNGSVRFILKEDGKDKNVTTRSYWGSSYYEIIFKNSNDEIRSSTGVLRKSDNFTLNLLETTMELDYRDYLINNSELRIVITSDYGSYSLGFVNFEGLEDLVYDRSFYSEGIMLMEQGKYEEALKSFYELHEISSRSYEHYQAIKKVVECGEHLGMYTVGMIGPAGGYIFYDCDADNDSGNADGLISAECGWRYLEAAPNDLGRKYCFGFKSDHSYIGTNTAIGTGKANTEVIVNAVETSYEGEKGIPRARYAAKACADYSIEVEGVVYDDWFLPSKDELNMMHVYLHKNGLGSFSFGFDSYLSSSEESDSSAWRQLFYSGYQGSENDNRSVTYLVRPVRAF